MTRNPAPVLAIIVNWNKRDFLHRLLSDLRALPDQTPFEVLVVDNASTDGSPEMVRQEFPHVHLLETGENLGGTGGFNAGMHWGLEHGKGHSFFWLMDNDIIIHPGVLDELMRAMEMDKRLALAGSTILALEDNTRVIECGARVDWKMGGLVRNAEGPVENLPAEGVIEADYVAACSLLARVRAIRNVGTWDPNYFIAWDDIDWGVRMKRAGYRVVGVPASRVEHETYMDRRATAGIGSTYVWYRNGLYFLQRFAPKKTRRAALRHHVRMLLTYAANQEEQGNDTRAEALRLAVSDFLDGVTGKPAPEIFAMKDEAETNAKIPARFPRRVAFLVQDLHEEAVQAARELKKQYPQVRFDMLVFDTDPDQVRARIPNKIHVKSQKFSHRIRLARLIGKRYGATIALDHVPPFLFEAAAPLSVRVRDGEIRWCRRGGGGCILRGLVRRFAIAVQTEIIVRRVLGRELPPVDYFNGKGSE